MPKTESAVAYCRVSTDKQEDHGYSLPSQEKFCQQKAKELNLNIVKVFSGHESAFKPGRKLFNEMLDYVIENEIKHVVCYAKDRLSRNAKDNLKIREVQDAFNVNFHYLNHSFSNDAMGRFSEHIIDGTAEFQSRYISERTKTGMLQKLSQGEWCSPAPYGYTNNKETKLIEIDPTKADNVRWLYQRYATGNYSISSLKQEFDSSGRFYTPSSRRITRSNVEVILKNRFYIGIMTWGGESFKGNHEKIITSELFKQVQDKFKSANRPKFKRRTFAYSGIITCARCGCAITSEIKKGKYIYYHCTGGKGNCRKVNVAEKIISDQMEQAIRQFSIPDDIADLVVKTLREKHREEADANKTEMGQLRKKTTEIKQKMDKAYDDKLDGVISEEMWRSRNDKWQVDLVELESMIEQRSTSNSHYLESGEKIIELSKRLYPLWLEQNPAEKRKMGLILLSNFSLEGANLHYNWRKPFCWMVEMGQNENKRPGQDSNL